MAFYFTEELKRAMADYEKHFGYEFMYKGHNEDRAKAAVSEIYERIKSNNPSTETWGDKKWGEGEWD